MTQAILAIGAFFIVVGLAAWGVLAVLAWLLRSAIGKGLNL